MFSAILNYLGTASQQSVGSLQQYVSIHNGIWVLNNLESCVSCPSGVMANCNNELFYVSSPHDVHVLELGKLVQACLNSPVKSCQYLLCDDIYAQRKLVFCSLCCINPKYINGGLMSTRQRVYEKIDSIIQFLQQDIFVSHFLATGTSKEYVLGWRENNSHIQQNKAMQGMTSFTQKIAIANAVSYNIPNIYKDFGLTIVKYPYVYQW